MRFLVDENLPRRFAALLRDEGHDVLFVRDAGLRGSSDRRLAELAIGESRIVITRDVRFPVRLDRYIPGMILFRVPPDWTGPQIVELLSEFMKTPAFGASQGGVTVVTPARTRSRRWPDA